MAKKARKNPTAVKKAARKSGKPKKKAAPNRKAAGRVSLPTNTQRPSNGQRGQSSRRDDVLKTRGARGTALSKPALDAIDEKLAALEKRLQAKQQQRHEQILARLDSLPSLLREAVDGDQDETVAGDGPVINEGHDDSITPPPGPNPRPTDPAEDTYRKIIDLGKAKPQNKPIEYLVQMKQKGAVEGTATAFFRTEFRMIKPRGERKTALPAGSEACMKLLLDMQVIVAYKTSRYSEKTRKNNPRHKEERVDGTQLTELGKQVLERHESQQSSLPGPKSPP
jgi:hypothetical protein